MTVSTPAEVLVTAGAAGVPGGVSGVGRKIAKPCCAMPFTMVKSPPRNMLVPSVAITRGPRPPPTVPVLLLPKSVIGVQCPSVPSVSDWLSRWWLVSDTCGKPPGT